MSLFSYLSLKMIFIDVATSFFLGLTALITLHFRFTFLRAFSFVFATMRSFILICACLALAGSLALSAPIVIPSSEGSNTMWQGPSRYRIGTVIPSNGVQGLGAAPVNLRRILDTSPSRYPERSSASGPLLSRIDPVEAALEITKRYISTDTSKGFTPSTQLERPTQPGEPAGLTMILPRDGATQPGGNVDPQDISAIFLTKAKETERDVRPPVYMKSDPCAQYPWD